MKSISNSQDEWKNKKNGENDNVDTNSPKFLGEEKEPNKLIVMDNVLGLLSVQKPLLVFKQSQANSGTVAFTIST